jgi:catechol 2,3-dioxygenase
MTGTQRIEHAELYVEDQEAAVEFYTDVFGLTEYDRRGDSVYLTCGHDERYDFVVTAGDTGVDHFAVRVDSVDELEGYAEAVETSGVDIERTHDGEDGLTAGVRFALPSGVEAELVVVDHPHYRRANETAAPRSGVAPVDLDHITLMSDAIREDVAFLEETLDFNVSEIHKQDADTWRFAWTRFGPQHHDVAFVNSDESSWTLHHLAWTTTSIDHIKSLADRMSQHGHQIEVGVSRHVVGSNIFAYFREPGGNRFELSTEMATLDDSTETRVNEPGDDVLSSWGGVRPPESYSNGS